MEIKGLRRTLLVGLPTGLAVLTLSLLWLSLIPGRHVVATAPIAGDPVSTEGATTILIASEGVTAVIAADLDNDGHVDLAFNNGSQVCIVANESTTATVSWAPSVTIESMSAPVVDLAAADFDRDGLMDLAVAAVDGSGTSELWLLRNPTSTSPFTASWSQSQTLTSTAQISLTAVAVGDLDGDGAPDLASAGDDGLIRLWHNPLTDTWDFATAWGASAVIVTGDDKIGQIAVADIDFDGHPDIVAVSGGSAPRARVWQNPGWPFSSTWSITNTLGSLDADGLSLAVSEFGGGGALDVAVGLANGTVLMWRNPLTPTLPFTTGWGAPVTIENGIGPVEVLQTTDLNNDGYPELIRGTSEMSPSLVIWHNEGKPFTSEWFLHTVGAPGRAICDLVASDFDHDGDADIISGDSGALLYWPNALIHRNASFASETAVGELGTIETLAVGDLDRDGLPDLVAASYNGYICLWRNNGTPFDGSWPYIEWYTPFFSGIRSLVLADLDGDGDLDMVTGHTTWRELRAWRNDGTPFDAQWTDTFIGAVPHGDFDDAWAVALEAGDLDRDGAMDVVVGTGSDFDLGNADPVTRSTDFGLYAWHNDGDPFSLASWSTSTISITLDAVNAVVLGDLNSDGWLDVVAGTNHPPAIGTISNPMTSTWPNAYSLRAFHNDGTPFDADWTGLNIGRDPETYSLQYVGYHGYYGARTFAVTVADLDNDGDLDVASGDGHEADYQVKVWENDGTPFDGALWSFSAIGVGPHWDSIGQPWFDGHVRSIRAGDIDQDGWVDIVSGLASVSGSVNVIYWENSGVPFGSFPTDTHWIRHNIGTPVSKRFEGVIAADLDRDGDLDVGTAIRSAGEPTVIAWQNQGGAVSEVPVGTASAEMVEGTQDDLVRVVVTHNGKWVDHDVELAWWRLTLVDGEGEALSSAQAANLFEYFRVYRDDGDDTWQGVPIDTLVVSTTNLSLGSGGILTLTFPVGDSPTTFSTTQKATFFVVATLQSDASVYEPSTFQVIFDPDAASLVKDHTTMSSASIADTRLITAGPVVISAGQPTTITLVASAPAIAADGNSTAVLTATVSNAQGHPVDGGTMVSFTTTLGSVAPPTGTTTSGMVTTTLTSSTDLGTAVITASAEDTAGDVLVEFIIGPPATVVVIAVPTTIIADDASTAIVTAVVSDAIGRAVADGTVVTFTTDLGSLPGTPYTTTTSGGVATATLTSGTTAGEAMVRAEAGAVNGMVVVTFEPGAVATVVVEANPSSIGVGGETSLVTATVRDGYGNVVADGTVVTFTTDLGNLPGTPYIRTTSGGVVTATLTSEAAAGEATVTVDTGLIQGCVVVRFEPGAPAVVSVEANPSTITIGDQTSTVTAMVRDEFDNQVADGTLVTFSTSLGSISSPVLTVGGVATAVLTSSNELGAALITATAGSISGNASVWFVAGSLARIIVAAHSSSLAADGTSTAVITAALTDVAGHIITETTTVAFTTTLGVVFPLTRVTSSGMATATLRASTVPGKATVTAWADGVSGQTNVVFVSHVAYLPFVVQNLGIFDPPTIKASHP